MSRISIKVKVLARNSLHSRLGWIKLRSKFLYEIRVNETACRLLTQPLYHLFWNNENSNEKALSDEMTTLIDNFALPRRRDRLQEKRFGELWQKNKSYFLDEYRYEYGSLHSKRPSPVEILHPLFVKYRKPVLKIGQSTDTHIDVRANVYEENLKWSKDALASSALKAYVNFNKNFEETYKKAKGDCDILLLTGDLIDYGRGHWGSELREDLRQRSFIP